MQLNNMLPCPLFIGTTPLTAEELAELPQLLPSLMLFAITWSLGASCDKAGRAKFDAHLRTAFASAAAEGQVVLPEGLAAEVVMMPQGAHVYEWVFDQGERRWVAWMDTLPEFKCDPDKPFSQIIVPTADTVRGASPAGAECDADHNLGSSFSASVQVDEHGASCGLSCLLFPE